MPLSTNDLQFKASWPGNTTPQAPDGSGAKPETLCGYAITNTAASARSVKFYDSATSPTVGTTVPKRTIEVAAGATAVADFLRGKQFVEGLWVAVTANPADTDNTAPTAGDVILTVDYQ